MSVIVSVTASLPSLQTDLVLEEKLDLLDPLRHLNRELEDHQDHDSDILFPFQRPAVTKEVIELSFSGTNIHPNHASDLSIKLAVDASPGCGGIAWPAGQVLASYLVRQGHQYLKNKTIVELGSGTGLVGLVGGALGGESIWITDQAPLLDIMRRNVLLNDLSSNVMVSELNWGEPLPDELPQRPDLILAADCVYFEPAFPLLVQTLSDLVVDNRTEVLFCYKKRRKADKRFFSLLKKKFTWTEIDDNPERQVYSREQISLLRLVKKPTITF